MHKARKNDARETRLLKPSISGNSLDHEELGKRASTRKLDLDAPLMSVRKNRSLEATTKENGSTLARVSRSSSNLGNQSMRRLVPFFTWEQTQSEQALVPDAEPLSSSQEAGLILAPPPRPQQQQPQQQIVVHKDFNKKNSVDCSDARSEFAYTEHASVAPTYVVSNVADDEDGPSAVIEYNSADRDMILQRFLPAAKAVAIERSSSSRLEAGEQSWRTPAIIHPSPQVLHHRRPVARAEREIRAEPEAPKTKSFAEFLSTPESVYGGDSSVDRSCSSHFIDTACGFFPLFRLLQTSTSACKPCKNAENQVQKIPDVVAESSEEEWFSDQGDEEEEECQQIQEYEQAQATYMACKYTPSRGGLKSPAIVESKGFLGMPRDRAGKTYIKRMYPVAESQTKAPEENDSDGGSLSSESLSYMKLDKRSAGNSRQSSNGGSEKVFCLDTLNQIRSDSLDQKESFFIGGEEALVTVVDERAERTRHPNLFEEEASPPVLYSSKKKQAKKKKKKMADTMKNHRASREAKDSYYEEEDEDEDDEEDEEQLKAPSGLRICWRDEGEDEVSKVLIPTPRGPAQSWLKKKLVQAQKAELMNAAFRKPPLARKPVSTISFESRQRF